MTPVAAFLRENAVDNLIALEIQQRAAELFQLTFAAVEGEILRLGLMPRRYARNRRTIGAEQQLRLWQSTVAVAGCGGLGGYIVEELARLGVGSIIVVDPDVFEEHNLNRQLFATPSNLGEAKVAVAAARVGAINPAVTLIPFREHLSRENGPILLENASLAIDALDNIPDRLALAASCEALNIPLVHGSIAGWYGQVLTQFPGERTLETLFGDCGLTKGIETELGNPAFLPALVASLEVAEAIKILLDEGTPLCRRLLSVNLLDMEIVDVTVGE